MEKFSLELGRRNWPASSAARQPLDCQQAPAPFTWERHPAHILQKEADGFLLKEQTGE